MRPNYKTIWLRKNRQSKEWLATKITEGFEIHHVDGNRQNNHPDNLILMYGDDHRRFHGLFTLPKKPINCNEMGRLGGLARVRKLSKAQHSRHARHMNRVRWENQA